ncbi:MAG: HAD-IA family hydrolase [Nitrosomonadales bacterium]
MGLDRALKSSAMTEYFHAIRTADQTFSKPHPAMLLEMMEEFGLESERVLMVGDTTHDLQMAINAGVDAVGVTHGAHPVEQLQELKPLALLKDFAELRQWFREYA